MQRQKGKQSPPTSQSAGRRPGKAAKPSSMVPMALGAFVLMALVLSPMVFYVASVRQPTTSLRDQLPSKRVLTRGELEFAEKAMEPVKVELDHVPVVVLSTGEGKWNTGVWPGYGDKRATLNWAAAGVIVDKTDCPHECLFTHDQSRLPEADAVLMELVNHPKFLGHRPGPVPWPAKRPASTSNPEVQFPLVGNFYMEPPSAYPEYTNDPALKEHVDFTVGPDRATSEFPITLICPWGKPRSEFLSPPPAKVPDHFMVYMNEHGVAPEYNKYVNTLFKLLGPELHAYKRGANTPMPPSVVNLPTTLDLIGTYKFALVTEPLLLKDWIEPDWSHALLAGAIPVYVGAPNIAEFTIGTKSFIDIRDFPAPNDLVDRLHQVANDPDLYQSYFAWKKNGLSRQFSTALDHCVHYAECRICEYVRRKVGEDSEKKGKAAEIASFS